MDAGGATYGCAREPQTSCVICLVSALGEWTRWDRRAGALLAPLLLLVLPSIARATEPRILTIFEGRQIAVPVPEGWKYEEGQDPHHGIPTVRIEDPKGEIVLSVSFFPDQDGRLASREGLETEARRLFDFYVETSVEKETRLTFFEAPDGLGVLTSFTDGKLDPKKIPEGEKLISTTGLRSWKGGYMIFTLLTDTTGSPAYKKALELVRSGIKQVKAPVAF